MFLILFTVTIQGSNWKLLVILPPPQGFCSSTNPGSKPQKWLLKPSRLPCYVYTCMEWAPGLPPLRLPHPPAQSSCLESRSSEEYAGPQL